MADSADQAQQIEEMHRTNAVARRVAEGPAATGECLWCEAELPAPRRWCDAGCRDEWQKTTGKVT